MKVGLTYDLRKDYLAMGFSEEATAEFDSIETIEGIETALQQLGYETERIGNIYALVHALAGGKTWDLVFNIAEGMYGLGREAQIPALLDAWNIPYVFSETHILALCLHKGMTKAVVREAGVSTADYMVIENEEAVNTCSLSYPLFLKPVGGGTGMGISSASLVTSYKEFSTCAKNLLEQTKQPVLVETFLTGREFTVGITGTGAAAEVVGSMEIAVHPDSDSGIYSYKSKQNYLSCTGYRLLEGEEAAACEEIALRAWRALGCRDGGRVDLKMDAGGVLNFLEVNPLAGLHPVDSDLPIISYMRQLTYQELIERIMNSALTRMGSRV